MGVLSANGSGGRRRRDVAEEGRRHAAHQHTVWLSNRQAAGRSGRESQDIPGSGRVGSISAEAGGENQGDAASAGTGQQEGDQVMSIELNLHRLGKILLCAAVLSAGAGQAFAQGCVVARGAGMSAVQFGSSPVEHRSKITVRKDKEPSRFDLALGYRS